ncbi:ABC transporter substrate-binding protein [Sporosarcina limicola]|uniref:ABC-type glycerol-3-phosphate transport system substrate-binding protein n=1 Tax=Sporosarcina limicola TaxID=34101 RepID=A0A927MLT8_9BACL|nr:extracellular solute-binding protein [Sporosarcina limicola]MBE1556326.1 ABC-type glycerol-3-phosphate transport system substrate-binding protein [Sporosarcina limicola]
MKKNLSLIVSLILLSALLLVGCQKEDGKTGETDKDIVTLDLWNNIAAGRTYFPILIEEFEKNNSGIKIKLNNVNVESSEAEYQAAISDNNLPDMFTTDAYTINEFVELGLVHELNDLFPEKVREEYTDGVFDVGNTMVGDDVYLFPIYKGGTYMMFYNKEVYEELGIETVPKTWEEVMTVGKEIYEKSGGASHGLLFGGQSGWLVNGVVQLMATEASPEAGYDYANGEYNFATVGHVETMEFFKNLLDNNALSPLSLENDSTVARELFTSGKAAFLLDGNWTGQLLHESEFENWGVVPLPTKDANGKQYGEFRLGSNDGMYVSKETKNWNEVKIFMEFLRENIYGEILKDGEPLIAKDSAAIKVELPFEEVNDIADIFLNMSIRVPNPIVLNPHTQEVRTEFLKNAPDESIGSVTMGYLTGQVKDLKGTLQKYTDDYNAEFTKAIDGNEHVTKEDYKFPNWVPYQSYTEENYKELNR